MALVFTIKVSIVAITGKTFPIKENIKAIGGLWNPKAGQWEIPIANDTPQMRAELSALVKEAMKAQRLPKVAPPTNELMRWALASKASKKGDFHWICCEMCHVMDWERRHTSCMVHSHSDGQSPNTFRINGKLYTGD